MSLKQKKQKNVYSDLSGIQKTLSSTVNHDFSKQLSNWKATRHQKKNIADVSKTAGIVGILLNQFFSDTSPRACRATVAAMALACFLFGLGACGW